MPITILNEVTGETSKDFYLANICNVIDALNTENLRLSTYSNINGCIFSSVNTYALNKDSIKDTDIFRVKNSSIPIFVSDKLKRVIKKNKITG